MPKTTHAVADPDVLVTSDGDGEARKRRSRVAEAWRIAMAHMQLGEIPIEQLDLGDPLPPEEARPQPKQADGTAPRGRDADPERAPNEAEIDESGDESFPASDPPSWPRSHA